MKRFLSAVSLTCILAVSAVAGDIPTSGAPSPPPPATNQITSQTLPDNTQFAPGDIPTSGFAQQVTDAALSALLTALAF
ncbi:MAG: hypothetical protein H7Z16_00110 [Pyrinomonadaceae bacterium]|nr:hypothetical protein [Pyrinomonadaceae bacterium]